MIITTTNIAALNPCDDRFNNFTNHYPNFNGSLVDFLNLDNITYFDKVWVFVRLATHIQNVKWSIMCAESVLHYYEDKYPNEKAPRKALEAAQVFVLEPNEKNRIAANAAYIRAAYAANVASNAASNAAHAAAYTATAIAYASPYSFSIAAATAITASYSAAAASNTCAAAAASAAEKQQEELNLMFMIEAIRSN